MFSSSVFYEYLRALVLWSCGCTAGLLRQAVEPKVSLHSDYLSLTHTPLRTTPWGRIVYGLSAPALAIIRAYKDFYRSLRPMRFQQLYDPEPLCNQHPSK